MTPTLPEVADLQERQRALDPARSFLVQAPAGSGKTELLIQRFLTLLARVAQPESVVAITFTRKAASEMQARVLRALHEAATLPEPAQEHDRHTWRLARAVWQRDRERRWELAANPSRLRIQTIDSLCATLTRQMPWLTRFGAQPGATEQAEPLYREAARNTLALIEQENDWATAVACVLRHLDNQWSTLENLLVDMLAKRDQWLRHILHGDLQAHLEQALERVVESELERLVESFPEPCARELLALARFAANNLDDPQHPCRDLSCLPGIGDDDRPVWQALAELLLTKEGEWRKAFNKNCGFPAIPSAKPYKQRIEALVTQLRDCEGLGKLLHATRTLPSCTYPEAQLSVIEALSTVLPLAVAQLHEVFRERSEVDFTEVSLRALQALGTPEAPTDLTLRLDARIEHLLVDEFQDTSISQCDLLTRMTSGWQPDDGRTLFCVGDPMQSIYRFRQAEVGLFLRAHEFGIGEITLDFVRLSVNFRSAAGIVEWVNHAFTNAFPAEQDIALGAIRYSPSTAFHPAGEYAPVTVHPFRPESRLEEAERILQIIRETQQRRQQGTIAVLVRAKTHLPTIVEALKRAGYPFRAVDIDQLGQRTLIQDLLALTRALLHLADRPAWLAILRAPWCGLTLEDLHTIAASDHQSTIWDLLTRQKHLLHPDARQRVSRLQAVLEQAFEERHRLPLRSWVEGVWFSLGGPACFETEADQADASDYFELLSDSDEGGDLPDLSAFSEQVSALFAQPDPQATEGLQLMSIHKAKGLQFDTVILPGLGRGTRRDAPALMLWAERPAPDGQNDLLLAPINETGGAKDPLYEYLRRWEYQKGDLESVRLLYVAATRAKQELHLLGHITTDKPAAGSLLERLWPVVQDHFTGLAVPSDDPAEILARTPMQLRRLPLHWQAPAPPLEFHWSPTEDADERRDISFRWVGNTLRHVGTLVHRLLQRSEDLAHIDHKRPWIVAALKQLGVPPPELTDAADRVINAIHRTLQSPRGQWIFDPSHTEVQCEFALTGPQRDSIIDRTFVDSAGTRWIIDFKTSDHKGGALEAFLDNEQLRYREQLEHYAELLSTMDSRPIRLALYFPLLDGWREWPAPANQHYRANQR